MNQQPHVKIYENCKSRAVSLSKHSRVHLSKPSRGNNNMIEISKVKHGTRVKLISNTAGAQGVVIGQEYVVNTVTPNPSAVTGGAIIQVVGCAYNLYLCDFQLAVVTKEHLEGEVACLSKRLEVAKQKLAYLNETGSAEVDDMEFKCFAALKAMASEGSELEKAKMIAALIRCS